MLESKRVSILRALCAAACLIAGLAGKPGMAAALPCPDVTGGTGSEIPTPFDLNRHVELADGEEYLLVGRIVFKTIATVDGVRVRPFFAIDLNLHPWLASAKRKDTPFYPLAAPYSKWKNYDGVRVKMSTTAHGRISAENPRGGVEYQIELSLSPRGTLEPYSDAECPTRPSYKR